MRRALLAALGLPGCLSAPPDQEVVVCRSTAGCDAWEGAFCQPSGACSVADPSCSTGHRYVREAPAEIATACVPGDVVSDLVLRLSFDEGAGGVVVDDSPAGAGGVLVGGVEWLDDGLAGAGLRFDGEEGRVEVDGDSTVFGDESCAGFAWVRSTDLANPQSRVLGRGYQNGAYLFLNFNGGIPFLESQDSDGVFWSAASDVDVAGNAWHHVGFVLDRATSESRVYADGRLSSARADPSTGLFGEDGDPGAFTVGGQNGAPETSLAGDVDEVWVFRRALADADVQLLFAGPLR